MSSKQTVLDREMFVQALRHMGEEDLLFLNRMVVERLNLLAQARSTVQLAQFAEGDRVERHRHAGVVRDLAEPAPPAPDREPARDGRCQARHLQPRRSPEGSTGKFAG